MAHRGRRPALGAVLCLSLGFSAVLQATPIRVIEEAAIPLTHFLTKADFDQRFPGELIDDPADLNTGWYVIYQHESLNYYFGPILLESIGQDYLAQLRETVEAAVSRRPSIQDYRLELSFEPSTPSSAGSTQSEPPADEVSRPSSLPPQPEPKPSFWSRVKRVFGF
ncbi:MAG: hypothetical protein EA353_12950 [Puniceicoccaceae bacterium]|nr:MAG: hypothetical protein EA353_12950 [Puniceicoccaceae bacterium]